MNWYEMKTMAVAFTGWPMDTLHVMAGVVLQLLAATAIGKSLSDARPWAIVLLLELGNEAYDLWFERWPNLYGQVGEGLRDVLATMLLPTLLLLLARKRPRLLCGRR